MVCSLKESFPEYLESLDTAVKEVIEDWPIVIGREDPNMICRGPVSSDPSTFPQLTSDIVNLLGQQPKSLQPRGAKGLQRTWSS